jgi:pimeloyl-ACP methyl ester carboxylesterase
MLSMRATAVLATLALASPLSAQRLPRAIYTDPPHDGAHPARMEVPHIPSHGVRLNGVVFVAAGAGVHPTLVFCHGLPGNEKGHDLAQAVRRAGWNVVTFNYRGSWGSPGTFGFDYVLEDADAVLAWLRDTATVRALGVDTARIVIAGHRRGGWVAAHPAAHDRGVKGAILISMADMGIVGGMLSAKEAGPFMADNMESLAGGTAETFGEDLRSGAERRRLAHDVPGLARVPMLVLTADDGLAPHSDSLVALVRRAGNARVSTMHARTDHSWSDERVALESAVLRWLARLPSATAAR